MNIYLNIIKVLKCKNMLKIQNLIRVSILRHKLKWVFSHYAMTCQKFILNSDVTCWNG